MSSLGELSQRFARLKEISEIMTAMKNLSQVETRKLSRFIGHQRRMLANIEAAAADFLNAFPIQTATDIHPKIILLIGSERGFCGNFNERVLDALDALPDTEPTPVLLAVGSRLGAKLASHPGVIAQLDGATLTEDVPNVLNHLMDTLHTTSRQFSGGGATLLSLAHEYEGEPTLRPLLPIAPQKAPTFTQAPSLQLPPPAFFAELLDQYLLATLYGLLYESLVAENRQRLSHMDNALDRLDETLAHMAIKRNALRQEKIVEEIEVILSSEMALRHPEGAPRSS